MAVIEGETPVFGLREDIGETAIISWARQEVRLYSIPSAMDMDRSVFRGELPIRRAGAWQASENL
jgi:hypothetical protein